MDFQSHLHRHVFSANAIAVIRRWIDLVQSCWFVTMLNLARLLDCLNIRIPGGRWQLLEFYELWLIPPFIRHDERDALEARWTKTIPFLQAHSLAELAADAVSDALDELSDLDTAEWTVIDFGSGRGGPVPMIEMLVNHGRAESTHKPIPFQLSDIHPDIDAWMEHASHSDHLSFIPQPVDASDPSFSAISATTMGDKDAARREGFRSTGSKIMRLYCESFHQFDDPAAVKVVQSTLQTSDAFVIVELQERRLFSLLAVLVETVLTMLCAITWFWHDRMHLLLTYLIPILPLTQYLDGLVGCLRRRSFEETLRLFERASDNAREQIPSGDRESYVCGEWTFTYHRFLHTWPIGYMTVISGRKGTDRDAM